jgi:hypothetical protein
VSDFKFKEIVRKFFPAKISFSKIQKKILAGKFYFAKERDPIFKAKT